MGVAVFRVQDDSGRGPYRPGFSVFWTDTGHEQRNPTFMDEFGAPVIKHIRKETHAGCAFRTIRQAAAWFTAGEARKMESLGYHLVQLIADRIIAESDKQLVVARNRPFSEECLIMPWTMMAR